MKFYFLLSKILFKNKPVKLITQKKKSIQLIKLSDSSLDVCNFNRSFMPKK